jgi:hypothetical protein
MKAGSELTVAAKIVAATDALTSEPTHDIRQRLISLINELMNTDFHALIQLLYRIDIEEEKLKHDLQQYPESDAASIIADLIIRRQVQKLAVKVSNRQQPGADDSW